VLASGQATDDKKTMKASVVLLAITFTSAVAGADVEIGATGGLHVFSQDNELGVIDVADATSLKPGPTFGLRFGFYGTMLGVELEGGLIPAKPRSGPSFDVYSGVGGAHLVLQFRAGTYDNTIIPFILGGGGAMRVVKTGNEMLLEKDTDPMGYGGLGIKFRGHGWGVRLEGRVAVVPSSAKKGAGGLTQDFEGLGSLYIEFGRTKKTPSEPIAKEPDPDNDVAVAPKEDVTPPKPEPTDVDKDGVVDADDKCKEEAEDKDGFQDDDGCPDPDNDGDGVVDGDDKCGDQPETKNGIADDDGCPDEIPANLTPFLGPIAGVSFKANTAVFAGRSAAVLDRAVAAIKPVAGMKLEIQAHTDDVKPKGKLKTNDALSQARADAVKAYLVRKGLDASLLDAKGYGGSEPIKAVKGLRGAALKAARAKNARIELKIVP
jgi:OmpA-OmpF porin, OOP family